MSMIRPREREAVLQSLRAGVVPRAGQRYIQVGRVREIEALLKDIERVTDGGTMFRLVIGEYGSGKTFFLNLVRAVAIEKKLVTVHADLNPDRRLHATGGQARSLFAELMKNLSTRAKPDGGALVGIIERFISNVRMEATTNGVSPNKVIYEKLAHLSEMVNGYDFATVIEAYWKGFESGQEQLKTDAIRWLRGEFTTKTDAKVALGVRTIIDDNSFYDQLKLLSKFVQLAGYAGVLVCLDEMVNLYKLANTQARNANYEQILRILNDSLQGNVDGLGFIFGGTPEFLMDARKGLYSYAALQSRLAENAFAKNGFLDYNHPVLRLSGLSQEEFLVLLIKLRNVFAFGDPSKYLIPDEGIIAFMEHCNKRIGDCYFRTPRTTITAFINLLSILEQYADADWRSMIGHVKIEQDMGFQKETFPEPQKSTDHIDQKTVGDDVDEFASFKL